MLTGSHQGQGPASPGSQSGMGPLSNWFTWAGERLTTILTEYKWPEENSKMSKNCLQKEEPHRPKERPKLDSARKLRGHRDPEHK